MASFRGRNNTVNKKIIGVFVAFVVMAMGVEWVRTEINNLRFEVKRLKDDVKFFDARHYEHRDELLMEVRYLQLRVKEMKSRLQDQELKMMDVFEERKVDKKVEGNKMKMKDMWLVDFFMAAVQQIDAR